MATKFFLPNLFEFIYNSIIEKGFNFLFNRLNRDEWLKVRTESKARVFTETANLEDKILLLTQLGISCYLILVDKEKQKTTKIDDVLIAYLDVPDYELPRLVAKDRIFACKDIDFIKSAYMVSKASMSSTYTLNRSYYKTRQESTALKTRALVNYLEAEKDRMWYAKTINTALNIEPLLEHFKINIVQFKILIALQIATNGATKEYLQKDLDRTNITGTLNEMYDNNLLAFSLTNKNVVMIDVYGVMVLEQIFAKFP